MLGMIVIELKPLLSQADIICFSYIDNKTSIETFNRPTLGHHAVALSSWEHCKFVNREQPTFVHKCKTITSAEQL